eukprot:6658236-Prymnesium_polylepis.2
MVQHLLARVDTHPAVAGRAFDAGAAHAFGISPSNRSSVSSSSGDTDLCSGRVTGSECTGVARLYR